MLLVFLKNMLTLYPSKSMAINIGMDATGEHCSETNAFSTDLNDNSIDLLKVDAVESVAARLAFSNFFKMERSINRRIFNKIKSVVGRGRE